MRNILRTTLAIVMVTMTIGAAAAYNISGFKLENETSSGLPNWNITLSNDTIENWTLTGSDGSYNFTGLDNGTYTLQETMQSGWTNVTPDNIIVTIDGADLTNVNFTNEMLSVENGTITGMVTDTNTSLPIENATVKVDSQKVTTDSSGTYTINIQPGTYDVVAEASNYSTNTTTAVVTTTNTTTDDIALTPVSASTVNGTITGVMTDTNTSLPIENATVKVDSQKVTTDSSGTYTISIMPGIYIVTASKTGYNTSRGIVRITSGNTTTDNIGLNPHKHHKKQKDDDKHVKDNDNKAKDNDNKAKDNDNKAKDNDNKAKDNDKQAKTAHKGSKSK